MLSLVSSTASAKSVTVNKHASGVTSREVWPGNPPAAAEDFPI